MKHNWLGQVNLYQEHKDLYNDSERAKIKKGLKEQMSKRLRELSEIYVKAVDKINNL